MSRIDETVAAIPDERLAGVVLTLVFIVFGQRGVDALVEALLPYARARSAP